MNADGSGETLLLGGEHEDSSAAWSPDGRRLAFVRDGQIAFVDLDGSNVRVITSGDLAHAGPSWSPDGSRIVFTRDPGSILVIGADGLDLARVPLAGRAFGVVWEPQS